MGRHARRDDFMSPYPPMRSAQRFMHVMIGAQPLTRCGRIRDVEFTISFRLEWGVGDRGCRGCVWLSTRQRVACCRASRRGPESPGKRAVYAVWAARGQSRFNLRLTRFFPPITCSVSAAVDRYAMREWMPSLVAEYGCATPFPFP